jgi:predicted small lipoprotein YifL
MKRLGISLALAATAAALTACGSVGTTVIPESSRSAEVLRAIPVPSGTPDAATPTPEPTATPAPSRKPHVLRAIPVPSAAPSATPAPTPKPQHT